MTDTTTLTRPGSPREATSLPPPQSSPTAATGEDPTGVPASGGATAAGLDVRARRLKQGLGAAIHVASWFFLSVITFMLGWVAVVWLLMGWSPTVISTGSMQPAISPGDIVMTAEPDADLVFEEGTVVTFEDPARAGELVTHRIVALNEDGTYHTRGDSNGVNDSTDLRPEAVVGVGRLLVPSVALPWVWFEEGRLGPLIGFVVLAGLAIWCAVHIPWDDDSEGDDDVAS